MENGSYKVLITQVHVLCANLEITEVAWTRDRGVTESKFKAEGWWFSIS